MTGPEFEQLIHAAGLNLLSSFPPRFLVSLHVEQEWGPRVCCDVLEYLPDEFERMTRIEAQSQIEALKKKLIRVAKTKTGVVK